MKEFIYGLEEIHLAAEFVLSNLNNNIIILDGQMGAGKTTLSKAICLQKGVKDVISSPTFSIVNEYRDLNNTPIYHFDFYRLNDIEEAIQIGVEDYFYSGNICLIEWASRVENILPDEFIFVSLTNQGENKRKLTKNYGE